MNKVFYTKKVIKINLFTFSMFVFSCSDISNDLKYNESVNIYNNTLDKSYKNTAIERDEYELKQLNAIDLSYEISNQAENAIVNNDKNIGTILLDKLNNILPDVAIYKNDLNNKKQGARHYPLTTRAKLVQFLGLEEKYYKTELIDNSINSLIIKIESKVGKNKLKVDLHENESLPILNILFKVLLNSTEEQLKGYRKLNKIFVSNNYGGQASTRYNPPNNQNPSVIDNSLILSSHLNKFPSKSELITLEKMQNWVCGVAEGIDIKNVSMSEIIVLHELSHAWQFNDSITRTKEYMNLSGWNYISSELDYFNIVNDLSSKFYFNYTMKKDGHEKPFKNDIYKTFPFVSSYGATSPHEDFAEASVYYKYFPEKLKKRSIEKYSFFRHIWK